MGSLLADLKYSLRAFVASPGFTFAAVAALALGIGVNTAVFSLANAVLLKPLNLPSAERAVRFFMTYQGSTQDGGPARVVDRWRRQTSSFEDVSASRMELMNLAASQEPEQLAVARVTASFFHLFNAPIALGRTFTSDEEAGTAGRFTVLSHALWAKRFNADPHTIWRQILLSGVSYEVIGVLGSGFESEQFDQQPDIWIPFEIDPESTEGGCYCQVNGRLRSGVSIGTARAQLDLLAHQYQGEFPSQLGAQAGFTVRPLREAMTGNIKSSLLILQGAVALVLLIACANVANLLLVRAVGRKREIAIRAALGAGRGRILRQLLTESVLLSVVGGAFGLVIGSIGIRLLWLSTRAAFRSSWFQISETFRASVRTGLGLHPIGALLPLQ